MELVVELSKGTVVLSDVDQMQRFAVRAVGPNGRHGSHDVAALGDALAEHDAGKVEVEGDVLVPAGAVRRLAVEAAAERGRALGDEWEAGLEAMLEYAATRGWLAEDGSIRAHVEWEG
jgi:hypothetical protein